MDRSTYSGVGTLGSVLWGKKHKVGAFEANAWVSDIVSHFFKEAYIDLWRGEVHGLENIPSSGPFLLAGNHVSFLDPIFFGSLLPRNIYYLARDTLFRPGFMNWLMGCLHCIPVKRESKGDVAAIKKVLKILHDGHGLLIFPEGRRSEDGQLQKAQPGLGMIACKTGTPVIPAYIHGTLDAWGRHQSMFSFKRRLRVSYGPALLPKDYDPGPDHPKRYQAAMNRVMEAIRVQQKYVHSHADLNLA